MNKEILATLIIFVLVLLIMLIAVLMVAQMENRFIDDCEKQNFQGIKKYWDLDINCSQIENIENWGVNETR